jgi:hypothetical protein
MYSILVLKQVELNFGEIRFIYKTWFINNIHRECVHIQWSLVNPDLINPEIQLSGQNFREQVDLHIILVFNILASFIWTICQSGQYTWERRCPD